MECRSYGQATRRKKQNMIVNSTSIVPCMARSMADTALLSKGNVLLGSEVVMYFVVVQSNLYLPFIGRDDKFFHHQVECILQHLPEARLVAFSFVHVVQDGIELVRMKKIRRI